MCLLIHAGIKLIHVSKRDPWMQYDYSSSCHNDAIKWKHFPGYWHFVWGYHRLLVDSLHKLQWCRTLMFYLIFIWTNNQDTGDLIYHHTHNDVTDIYHKDTCGPFYKQELASPTFNIILWIMDKKLNTQISWDVITYPCPYINGGLS